LAALADDVGSNPETIASARRLGVLEHLQPDHVSTNQVFRDISQTIKAVPGSTARASEVAGLERVAKRADDLIEELGGLEDLSLVSSNVKGRLSAIQEELDKRATTMYDKLEAGIPRTATVEAPSALKFIEQQATNLGGIKNLSTLERSVQARLKGTPTYALLDTVRKEVGSATRGSGKFKDSERGIAKKLYSELSKDQEVIANAHGMGDVFKAANSAVQLRKGVEDDFTSLFSKALDGTIVGDISSSIKALPAGDTSKFLKLMKAVPEDMRAEVVASGLATAFGKTARHQTINFGSFAAWMEGLKKNKQAHAALMSNLPKEARANLNDLYNVAKGISLATKERAPTGRVAELAKQLDSEGLVSKIWGLAKGAAIGAMAGAVGGPVGIGTVLPAMIKAGLTRANKTPLIKAADELIISTPFTRFVMQASKGEAKPAAKKLAASRQFKKFMNAMDTSIPVKDREQWILQSLKIATVQYNNN